MAELETRMLIDGEGVVGDGTPLEAFQYPYSRYTGGEAPHGA